jgi:hypothetical protein
MLRSAVWADAPAPISSGKAADNISDTARMALPPERPSRTGDNGGTIAVAVSTRLDRRLPLA